MPSRNVVKLVTEAAARFKGGSVSKKPMRRAYVALPDDAPLDDEAIDRVAAALAKDMYRQLVGGDADEEGGSGADTPS